MGPSYRFGGISIDICICSLLNLCSCRSKWKCDFFFFLGKTQRQEQLINLAADTVLVATGAVSSGFWALGTVKGAPIREICKDTSLSGHGKDLTRRPRSCHTICMSTSKQILFSRAIHRPTAAMLIGEVATQVWYRLEYSLCDTEFWATQSWFYSYFQHLPMISVPLPHSGLE